MAETMPRARDTSPQARRKRYRGPAYDWRDHPDNQPFTAQCDSLGCGRRARWAIARPEDWPDENHNPFETFNWIIRAHACGVHLNAILGTLEWGLDVVQLYDLATIPEGGC
jgi:hypothetical protein